MRGEWIKVAYLAALGADVLIVRTFASVVLGYNPPLDPPTAARLGTMSTLLGLVRLLMGVIWIYDAWAGIPFDARLVDGQRVTPGGAAARLFIPFYNLYWMF